MADIPYPYSVQTPKLLLFHYNTLSVQIVFYFQIFTKQKGLPNTFHKQ